MKTLLLIPMLGLLQPMASARPNDSSDCPATGNTTATPARSPAPAESEVPAKKNSAAPSAPRAPTPKQQRAARPSYLFM
jgi:hypothetical protein